MIVPRCTKLFLLLIIWRLTSVFIVRTSHVPDEYWQSLEVAHKLTFGYGYLTWEWQAGIRSYLYPFLISIFYSLLKLLNIDYPSVIVYGPRVFQALLSAYADYSFYVWTGSKLALLSLSVNWYWYYCATRTLINSFETCLTIIALCKYPWTNHADKNTAFLWIVGFLTFARPTSVVIWLPLCLYHLFKRKSSIIWYLATGLFYFIVSTVIDSICYGKFILSPLEFFKINVLNRVSEQYGKMHELWYLFSGLPALLGLNYCLLPFAAFKVVKNFSHCKKSLLLTITIVWSLLVYSLLAHKEFRFILPLLPMLTFVIHETIFLQRVSDMKKKFFVFVLIISNLLPGIYFSVLHQKGSLEIMKKLRNDLETMKNLDVDILFLTTCHATPYYSHLHKNVSMRFLTCEPNLDGAKDYIDEVDKFRMNPMNWLEINYLNNSKVARLPSHVIIDDSTVNNVKPFLKHYEKLVYCKDVHFAQHGQFNGYMVYKYLPTNSSDANKSLDEICESLDNLTIQSLELIEEKVQLTVQLENLLRQGHIDMAKARYIRGKESIGMLQIPSEDKEVKSIFELETTYDESKNEKIPYFDISLKVKTNEDEEEAQDPIKWFGLLVPQSLKSAQRYFQDAIYLTVKLANLQAEIAKSTNEMESLKSSKKLAA